MGLENTVFQYCTESMSASTVSRHRRDRRPYRTSGRLALAKKSFESSNEITSPSVHEEDTLQ